MALFVSTYEIHELFEFFSKLYADLAHRTKKGLNEERVKIMDIFQGQKY